MVSVDATLRVMRVFVVGTPAGLVLKHIEGKYLYLGINMIQVNMEVLKVHQTVWYEIILYT